MDGELELALAAIFECDDADDDDDDETACVLVELEEEDDDEEEVVGVVDDVVDVDESNVVTIELGVSELIMF